MKLQQRLQKERQRQQDEKVLGLGDLVYLFAPRLTELQTSSRKFQPSWIGPLVISRILDHTHFMLADLQGKELKFLASVHINLLKPYVMHLKEMEHGKLKQYTNIRDLRGKHVHIVQPRI